MSLLRSIYLLAGIGLAGLIAYAIGKGDFWQEGAWLTSNAWGLVTLADLYLGFAVSAFFIAAFERRFQSLLWIIPLPFLGNVWTVVWLAVRMPEIARRLRQNALFRAESDQASGLRTDWP